MLDLKDDIGDLLSLASNLKKDRSRCSQDLNGKTLAMVFEKSSTRTRVSFEVGMTQCGGHAIYLSQRDTQLGRGETIEDTARVLSRMVDCIMYRAYNHDMMLELGKYSTVSVINALDDLEHPCQIMADLLTIREHKGGLRGLKIAYVGDGNNVCNSLLLGAAMVGMDMTVGCPDDFRPNKKIVQEAARIAKENKCDSKIVTDPLFAVKDADVLYTDTWVSMGQEAELEEREKVFKPYQINKELLSNAAKDSIVLHCLPAHRGSEITDEVMDGPQSVVFDEAENRLHAQKAILLTLMK